MKKLIAFLTLSFILKLSFASITITPSTIDSGYCQHSYSFKTTASGGTAPYAYTISVGALPNGLFMNKQSGVISGNILLTNDTAISFTVKATDAKKAYGTRAYTMYITNKVVTWSTIWPEWNKMPNTYPENAQVYDTWRLYALGASSSWLLNGNTLGAAKTLGSIDNYSIGFKTHDSTRAVLSTIGRFTLGTTTPGQAKFYLKNDGGTYTFRALASNNVDVFTVRESEKVGVRTLDPTATFMVTGATTAASDFTTKIVNSSGTNGLSISNAGYSVLGNADNSTGGYLHVSTLTSGNGWLFVNDGGNSNTVADYRLQILGNNGADLNGYDNAGHIRYSLKGQTGVAHLTVDNDALTGGLEVDNVGTVKAYHKLVAPEIPHDSTGITTGNFWVDGSGLVHWKY